MVKYIISSILSTPSTPLYEGRKARNFMKHTKHVWVPSSYSTQAPKAREHASTSFSRLVNKLVLSHLVILVKLFIIQRRERNKKWETLIRKIIWVASMFCACFGFLTPPIAKGFYRVSCIYWVYSFYYLHYLLLLLLFLFFLIIVIIVTLKLRCWANKSWRQLRFSSVWPM